MPSSYTTSLRLTLPATGELAGQWGQTVNTGITELLDAAVAGTASISTWGGPGVAYTLSNNSGTADEARRMFIVATGTPGEAKNVICPAVSKFYVFRNDTTGGFALTLKTSGGTGISVPAGQYKLLYCDGTNVVETFNSAGALTLSGALSVGGTATFAANPTLSAGTANQVQYLNASKVLVGSANLTFDGTALTLGGNPTVSAGTANGVTYLNGSKVLTSGSALTFNGSNTLTFDGGSASYLIGPTGEILIGEDGSGLYIGNGGGGVPAIPILFGSSGTTFQRWFAGGGEQMRLTSTGLGIGTSSPAAKFETFDSTVSGAFVANTPSTWRVAQVRNNGTVNANNAAGIAFVGRTDVQPAGIVGVQSTTGGGAAALAFLTVSSNTTAESMRLDSSGNLGLGVTPSAWASQPAIQQTGGAIWGINSANYELLQNAFYNGTNYIYRNTNLASRYNQNAGVHSWFTAPSGTAGNAISFSQAMTLDASGKLLVGTTSSPSQQAVIYRTSATTSNGALLLDGDGSYAGVQFASSGTLRGSIGVDSSAMYFTHGVDLIFKTGATNNVGGTERARITSGGDLLVGTTATTSGARLDVKGVDSTGGNYCVFFENSSSALLLAVQNDGRWRSGTAAASPYNFVVGATNRDLFVDNAGEIGYVASVRASKINITPVADTEWLLQLNPVTFNFRKKDAEGNYTDKADGPIKHGLIAEEVESVNPDLCFYDDEDKGGALRGVNYSHLITPMLKLLQEQQALITDLRARVAALEA